MIKDIVVSGKLTVKDLLSFMFYHNYSKLGGKLTGLLGIIGLILSPIMFFTGDKISGIAFGLVAFMYVVVTPLDFYSKALRQLKSNPVFKNKMTFVFSETFLHTTMYTGATEVPWADIVKVVSAREHIYIYITEANALVVPKENFACLDDVELLEAFIEDKELNIHNKKRVKEEEHVSEDI